MAVKIQVLVEDTGSEQLSLGTEHGLSLFVSTPEAKFIFDCGATGLAWENARRMNAPIREAAFVVISHSHYDHAGGFPQLFQWAAPKKLYVGAGFWEEKYAADPAGGRFTYLGAGFGEGALREFGIEAETVEDVKEVAPGAWLLGNFPRIHDFETIPRRFVKGEGRAPDDFSDEICLALAEGDGLAVVAGCSHPGILNMVQTVRQRLNKPVYSVIGGTHLKEAAEARLDLTLKELKEAGLKRLALCHCSGGAVRDRLKGEASGCLLGTGDELLLA